jgi:hypothetical protein
MGEEVIEVDLTELTKEDFYTQPSSYLVLSDVQFDRQKMTHILSKIKWEYGTVITNGDLILDYYLNDRFTAFYRPENVFKRFSKLMVKRCFSSHSYIVLDNYCPSKQQIKEFENYKKKAGNMILFWIDSDIKDLVEIFPFDYVIITTMNEMKGIKGVYNKYIKTMEFHDFVDIIRETLQQNCWFVLKVTKCRMMYIDVEEML